MIGTIKKNGLNFFGKHGKVVRQTSILFISQIAILSLGFLIKFIQTRGLGVEQYGLYTLFGTLTAFVVLFVHFGIFTSLKVLLANNQNQKIERELIGAGYLYSLLMGLLFVLIMWIISFFVDALFVVQFGNILRILSPLCFIIPFRNFIFDISIGTNKVGVSSLYDVSSKILFVLILSVFFFSKI